MSTKRFVIEKDLEMTTRDGCVLRANAYRPDDDERHPVLLLRTPYNKNAGEMSPPGLLTVQLAIGAGYAVIIQDVRNSGASDGADFFPYRDEGDDGADTVAWAATLPFSDGNVGAMGISYLGGTTWQTAAAAPPSLRAVSAVQAPVDFHRVWWRGGALRLSDLVGWMLYNQFLQIASGRGAPAAMAELIDAMDDLEQTVRHTPLTSLPAAHPDDASFAPFFFEVLRHPEPDGWSNSIFLPNGHRDIQVPALIVAGWHDSYVGADLEHFTRMRTEAATAEARERTRIIVGPWTHGDLLGGAGDLGFGMRSSAAAIDLTNPLPILQLRWFDHWLRGADNGVLDAPPVWVFVQGVNRWRQADAWPPAAAQPTPWYLRAGGGLDSSPPRRESAPDTYVYDPLNPCPTRGGTTVLASPKFRAGPVDQAPVLSRRDVLVYTSEPLSDDIEIIGPVTAVLHAATSAPDTDWVVKLCDVHPDGPTLSVTDGILRARYRHGLSASELVQPGAVERYEIELDPTAMVFKAGHRLRVIVTSSDFPRYDRNPNTGERSVEATTFMEARQHVFHDPAHLSHVVLPVMQRT